jgi:hypothetical protein
VASPARWFTLPLAVVAMLAFAVPSSADHGTRPNVGPIQPMGDSPHVVPADLSATGRINTDLAFWGNRAYQGLWNGFRIIDISNPAAPVELQKYEQCVGSQGDVMIWENWLMRTQDGPSPAGRTCDGDPVPVGFEGIEIFNVSNPADPDLVMLLETPQGAHTATLVPDLANNRLLSYGSPSSAGGIEIAQIPLSNPAASTFLRNEPTGRNCHDTQVFLGDVNRVLCAGGNGFTMLSIEPADGGALTNPIEMYSKPVETPDIEGAITVGHSGAFTWDGKMFAFGHEPGGGTDDQCDAEDREINRTQFFFETETGKLLGTWTMDPPQSEFENCTIHNYNFIPLTTGRDIIVGGHYQAGTWVVDATDPKNPKVIARSDPPPLNPAAFSVGGAWSSYWYDGHIYESEITKGLHIFKLNDPKAAPGRFRPEAFSNPQTQMQSIPGALCKGLNATEVGTNGKDRIVGEGGTDIIVGLGGNDRISGLGGADIICGGGGKDRIKGGGDNDRLYGQGGRDTLNGGFGIDRCVGGGGKDKAKGCETRRSI